MTPMYRCDIIGNICSPGMDYGRQGQRGLPVTRQSLPLFRLNCVRGHRVLAWAKAK
jgi:hypothetical protein